MQIEILPEVLQYLSTPLTWAIAEILAFVLFFYCVADAMKRSDDNSRIYRVLELFGFVFYAGLFENIGVLTHVYDYSLDRLVMVGVVPLSLLMFEAVIFYAALQFAEAMNFHKWARPFVVGFLGVLQDLTIDPVAVFDLHLVNGVMEGRWNWTAHYSDMFFGIPFFNYSGWFLLMFYYATLIQIGRDQHEKSGYKGSIGTAYVIIAPLVGVLLILSPITQFMLFIYPIFPLFLNRTAEIVMLSCIAIATIAVLIKYRPKDVAIDYRDYPVIWIMPLVLHAFNIVLAFSLMITIAYIPVLLFAGIHLGYLGYYLFIKPESTAKEIIAENE